MSTKASNVAILNAMRSEYELENRLPEATLTNLSEIFTTMMSYSQGKNQIIPSLLERIGLQTVDSTAWRNPLAMYKKDPMRYGMTHEETFVNMCKGKLYDPRESYEAAFQQYQSYIMTVFHKVNLNMQYPVTVTFDNLRSAFLQEYGIRDLMGMKMQSAVSGANWDEYNAMKGMVDTGYEQQVLPAVTVDEASAKKMLAEVKSAVDEFKFPNPANNIAGATSTSEPYNLIFITTPKINAQISVDALAYAFHLDKAQTDVRTVIVDKFANSAIQGVLMDIRFFNVRDQFREMSDQRLANVLAWNYFYTMVEMISASPFYPIRVFTTDTVATETLTISATGGTYKPGTAVSIPATVKGGTGTYHQKLLTYSVTGATSKDTYILPGTDQLYIGSDETASTLTVEIVYRPDETIKTTVNFTKSV
jgi:hypothetical protein